jgi:hypothetical protein
MRALDTRYATRTLCKQSREYRKTWSTYRCKTLLDYLGLLLSRLMARHTRGCIAGEFHNQVAALEHDSPSGSQAS